MNKSKPLSARARALLKRVRDGHFYHAYSPSLPAAMQELIDHKLVVVMGRVELVSACYVPKGTKPLKFEAYPKRNAAQ